MGPIFPTDWEEHARAIATADAPEGSASASVLTDVSHLRLLEPLSSPHFSVPYLAHLRNLTHLALVRDQSRTHTGYSELDTLIRMSNVCMVVISFDLRTYTGDGQTKILDIIAARARRRSTKLFVLKRELNDPVLDWEGEIKESEGVWSQAMREQEERDERLVSVDLNFGSMFLFLQISTIIQMALLESSR